MRAKRQKRADEAHHGSGQHRVSMKLLSLQKLYRMDVVALRHILAALSSVGGAHLQQDVWLNREEVSCTLNRMFHFVSQEVPGHVTAEAPEEMCSLMFRLFDSQTGCVSAASLQTALIALSAETLLVKYRALVSLAVNSSGSVSRSGLRSVLQNVSQVPAAVLEAGVFGGVEVAVKSCFNGVLTQTAAEEHVLSWLQNEPHLLRWLPTLYRLSISQSVSHGVRCHTCKTFPITGLRYRCMKCVNIHVCQSCFLTDRQTKKHKTHHPVLEFCTQPTWRESLSSLLHVTRHALLPQRYTQREADRKRVLMWAEPGETQDRAPPPSDPSTRLTVSAIDHNPSLDRDVSHDASVQPPPGSISFKCLQTDEEPQAQQSTASALLAEVRNLQRDKWLLEQQLQAWRLTVQSDQGILEDRCSEMEVNMEKLREDNVCLQSMLTQALTKMEAQQHTNNTLQSVDIERGNYVTPSLDTGDEEEEDEEVWPKTADEWSEEEQRTPSPTMHQETPLSHDIPCEEEEECEGDRFLCGPTGQQEAPEEVWPQEEDTCLFEEGHCGMSSPEELLQETVDRLKTVMETGRWRWRQTGEGRRAELLQSADQVGDSIHQLVDAVRKNTQK
uniref:dystrotelin isoform X2 n=1 Tax=Scatophagus argus TaxID=75038 RepID=UPI001ED80A52|nr:dystrotelin isoform X2 [Scatophagus argus]